MGMAIRGPRAAPRAAPTAARTSRRSGARARRGAIAILLGTVMAVLFLPGGASAQVVPTTAAERLAPGGALPPIKVSPGGAFLRAILVPGWGHASIGSYTRGGFYFGAQTATVYTLLRTRHRLNEARERVRFREDALRAQIAGEGLTDTDLIEQRLADDADLTELQNLLDSRESQQEDLVALGIFILLLSGADAYVSAHLARFPEPLELEARPVDIGRVDVSLRFRLPN